MNKIQTLIVIVLAGVLLALGLMFLVGPTADPIEFDDQNDTADDVSRNSEWETYHDDSNNLNLWYPSEATVTTEANRVKITYLGPDNSIGSEITDGFTFFVHTTAIPETTDLVDIAESEFSEAGETAAAIISELQPATIAHRSAYTFSIETGLGPHAHYIIMQANTNNAFIVSYSIANPNNRDYDGIISTILNSLQLTNGSTLPIEAHVV